MEKVTDQGLRLYGLALFAGMGLATWVLWTRGVPYAPFATATLGAAGLILGLVAPQALHPIFRFSRASATALGTALAWVLTAPLYWLLFTPLALLIRVFGADSMSPRRTSGWKAVPQRDNDPAQMERLW